MFQKTVLPNGLRVIDAELPHTRSVSVCIFLGAGSRYEQDSIAGVSHFLEHMLFKGTERRPTAREIAEEIEGVGGIMNAATDKELTVYWAKVGDQHFDRTLDLLTDSLCNSLLEPGELEKERAVILDELAMTEDNPSDLVNLLIDEVVWPDQPLGRDAGGTPESVRGIQRSDVVRYMDELYAPQNTVISIAGNVHHFHVVEAVTERLGRWTPRPIGTWFPAVGANGAARLRLRQKKTEQAHFCLAGPGLSSNHPDRYALDLLNAILGEGMSSRLFLDLRENRGLCYDVHSYTNHFLDAGSLVVNASVEPRKLGDAIAAAVEQLASLAQPVPDRELRKAKELIKGRLQLRMEDTRAVSSWAGTQELLLREILKVDDVLDIIDRLTVDDLARVGQLVANPATLRLAVVGPVRSAARLERYIAA